MGNRISQSQPDPVPSKGMNLPFDMDAKRLEARQILLKGYVERTENNYLLLEARLEDLQTLGEEELSDHDREEIAELTQKMAEAKVDMDDYREQQLNVERQIGSRVDEIRSRIESSIN